MIDGPISDLSRSVQHEPDRAWPTSVKVELLWVVGGMEYVRTMQIDADHFFGIGGVGAPMDGSALVGMIENMRREGPPPIPPSAGRPTSAQKKR